jgi:hypothetical protein
MKETDKAYIAGLIDGEGSVCLTRFNRGKRRAPAVTLPNTSTEPIKVFHSLCAGAVCNKPAKPGHKPSQHVSVKYNNALKLLAAVRPYMRHPKKCYRADLLLSEYKSVTPRNGKYTPELEARRADFVRRFFHPV